MLHVDSIFPGYVIKIYSKFWLCIILLHFNHCMVLVSLWLVQRARYLQAALVLLSSSVLSPPSQSQKRLRIFKNGSVCSCKETTSLYTCLLTYEKNGSCTRPLNVRACAYLAPPMFSCHHPLVWTCHYQIKCEIWWSAIMARRGPYKR